MHQFIGASNPGCFSLPAKVSWGEIVNPELYVSVR